MQSASQPGTPGAPAGGMFAGGAMLWNGFCQPLPYSPTALQIAAASGALGSDPSTPVRSRPGSAGAATAAAAAAGGGAFMAVMPGSPMMVSSPGPMRFAQVGAGRLPAWRCWLPSLAHACPCPSSSLPLPAPHALAS